MDHKKYHENISKRFHCGFKDCRSSFKCNSYLSKHLIRSHNWSVKKGVVSIVLPVGNEKGQFACTVAICKKETDSFAALIKQLRKHVQNSESVTCPHENCISKYDKLNSFSSHLTKKHRKHKNEIFAVNNMPLCCDHHHTPNNLKLWKSVRENLQSYLFSRNPVVTHQAWVIMTLNRNVGRFLKAL